MFIVTSSLNIGMSNNNLRFYVRNVGFLKYYTLKNIPNFLIAAPILVFSFYAVYLFVFTLPRQFFSLGFISEHHRKENNGVFTTRVLVFIYHWFILLLVSVCILHVQVSTRFMSSCAPFYWFFADFFLQKESIKGLNVNATVSPSNFGIGYILWSLLFGVIGTCLFSSHLPWT